MKQCDILLIMLISMQSICDWAGTNPAQRKFVEGERVFQAGHIIKCGKNIQNSNCGMVSFTALCLQTSNLKEKPHEINGEVTTSGKIIFCTCSCKAGLGEKCKHIIAALLYCYQKGEALETLSCTDKQCEWKQVHQKALINYNAAPLLQHQCFLQPSKKIKIIKNATIETNIDIEKSAKVGGTTEVLTCIESSGSSFKVKEEKHASTSDMEISEIQQSDIKTLITKKLPDSAFAKHISGRHNQITIQEKSKNKTITNIEKEVIKMIFQHQDNEIMQALKQLQVNALQECCENILNKLSGDLEQICVDTKEWFAKWLEERQFRITGSICYNVYTYTKNKNPDWKKKCKNTFTPKAFKTKYTEYGKKTEEEARNTFRENTNKTVIEIGLVVSRLNPWLAYSPDGVILKDQKPVALLEIKCPFKGKTSNIEETVDSQLNKCLIMEGENIVLKEKHRYYGQIQLGMAVLNLNLTYFVIYSAFDKKLHTIRVSRNNIFIVKMLTALKKVYYNIMLHEICLIKDNRENCDKHASDTV